MFNEITYDITRHDEHTTGEIKGVFTDCCKKKRTVVTGASHVVTHRTTGPA